VINRNESARQRVTVPAGGYLRDGVALTDALGAGNLTTSGGKFSVTLDPLKAAIFIMTPDGQDITGPAAPTQLTATATNGVTSNVSLNWTGNGDSAGYNIG
jgi:hypothetical protein